MRDNVQWFRVGLGLVGMGYGIYQISRGRRDWFPTAVTTAGFSMALSGITNQPVRPVSYLVQNVADRVDHRLTEAVVAALT